MKISIITPTFNSARTLGDTLESLRQQKKDGFELESIIIDGGSVDATLSVIESYRDVVSHVVSESDRGIYDAMNKGIRMATGEVIGILNSDDFYKDASVLSDVSGVFSSQDVDACYGGIEYVRPYDTSRIIRWWRAEKYQPWKLWFGWAPPHPAFFVRKKLYDVYGLFRIDIPVAADYEFMLRLMKKAGVHPVLLSRFLVVMRDGGNSARNFSQRLRGWQEICAAWRVNGWRPPFFLIPLRVLLKLHQIFI